MHPGGSYPHYPASQSRISGGFTLCYQDRIQTEHYMFRILTEQFDMLAIMGCELFQGYFFAKPMPVGEFEKFLCETKEETK